MDASYTPFLIALAVFLGSHMALGRPSVRKRLAALLGDRAYITAHSLLSVVLLGWLLVEAGNAPKDYIWPWIFELHWVPNLVMPLAFVLLVGGMTTPNPLSIIAPDGPFDPARPGLVVAVSRHPVLLAFALWSAAHLFPNGELALAGMFFVFAVFALMGMKIVDRKRRRALGEEQWQALSSHTSNLPFAAWLRQKTLPSFGRGDAAGIAGGLALYAFFYTFHEALFSKTPVPPFPW